MVKLMFCRSLESSTRTWVTLETAAPAGPSMVTMMVQVTRAKQMMVKDIMTMFFRMRRQGQNSDQ